MKFYSQNIVILGSNICDQSNWYHTLHTWFLLRRYFCHIEFFLDMDPFYIRCRSILGEEKSCIWDFFFFNLHNLLQIRFVATYAVLCETCPIYAPFTWTKTWAQDFVRGERMTNIMCMIHCHSNMECGLWQMCIGHMIKWWEEKNHNLRTCNNLLLSSTLMKACDISYVVYIRNSIIHKTMLWLLFVSLNLWGKN